MGVAALYLANRLRNPDKYEFKRFMIVTVLSHAIGFEKERSIAHKAFKGNLTFREADISTG